MKKAIILFSFLFSIFTSFSLVGAQSTNIAYSTYKSCFDGSIVSGNETCPTIKKCTFGQNWNGYSCVNYNLTPSYTNNDQTVGLLNKKCSDGSSIPETSPCPASWVSVCDNSGWASAWEPSCHYVYVATPNAQIQKPVTSKTCTADQFWNGYMCDRLVSFDDPVYPTAKTQALPVTHSQYSNYTYSTYTYSN